MNGLTKNFRMTIRRIFAWLFVCCLLCSTVLSPWTGSIVNAGSGSDEVAFETLSDTLGEDSVNATKNASTKLGTVSEKQKGFMFQLTRPGASASGQIKIGLYNTTKDNVWANGYILHLTARQEEGKLGWAVRKGATESALAFNDLTGLTGDTITVRAWMTDINESTGAHIFHISINDTEIYAGENSGDITTGCYMAAYNEVSVPMVFTSVVEEVDDELTFETIKDTVGVDSVDAAKNASTNLGTVSAKKKGFQFNLTRPGTSAGGQIKIGLWNTSENNVWTNGYILVVQPRSEEGKLGWAMRKGSNEGLFAFGDLTDITGDTITVRTWMTNLNEETGAHTIHVSINDTEIFNSDMGGDLLTGCYMAVYNEVSVPMVFTSVIEEQPEPDEPDVPDEEVVFDDLAQDSISAPKAQFVNLGQISGTDKGFRFQVTRPDEGQMKIGLYNTQQADPWRNGYVLLLSKGSTAGSVNWNVRSGANESAWAAWGDQVTDMPDEMDIYVWLNDVEGAKKLNVIIAGKRVITDGVAVNGSSCGTVTLGTYMSVYNEQTTAPIFKTLYVPSEPDPEPETPDVPDAGVAFDDLAKTTIKALKGNMLHLGQVSSTEKGFRFKVTRPDEGQMKIGLYNTQKAEPWRNGYVLLLAKGSTPGTVNWNVRSGANESAWVAWGDQVTDVPDEMEVYVWLADVAGVKKLNMIIAGKRVITDGVAQNGSCGDVMSGTYMSVYNEQTTAPIFKTLGSSSQIPDPDPNTPAQIPSDVVFQDLGKTVQKNTVKAPSGDYGKLGQLGSIKNGFKFKVTTPKSADAGRNLKIGLYNTEVRNPWANGYILCLSRGETTGSVNWAVRLGNGEDLVDFGTISSVSGTMTVYVWISNQNSSGYKINIVADGKQLLSEKVDSSVKLGTYLSAYNEWKNDAIFYTFVNVSEANTLLPTDTSGNAGSGISFEDLGQTIVKNKVKASVRDYGNLGQVSSLYHGFQVKVTAPNASDQGKNLKIGLYNTEVRNPWADGYILALTPGSKDGSLKWTLMLGRNEELLDSGEITGVPSQIEVKAWLTDINSGKHTIHVAVNGKELIVSRNDGSVKVGTYMAAYNEWVHLVEFLTYQEVREANTLLPVNTSDYPESGVQFDDLLRTIYRYTLKAHTNEATNLGQVTDLNRGFKFKVTAPSMADKGKTLKIGFYNTSVQNPWFDGFLLVLTQGENAGEVDWSLMVAKTEDFIESGTLTGVTGSDLTVMAWLTDIDASGHTIHVVINGKEIVACRNDGSTKVGTYMAAYNGWERVIQFKSAAAIPNLSGDTTGITFEDMGKTVRMNELTVKKGISKGLGKLSNKENGFRFIITTPTAADTDRNLKIGLYNTNKKNPWADGYILVLTPREGGNMGVALIKGKDETKFVVADDLTGVDTAELMTISVWITDMDKKTGVHTIHIMINDEELIAYTCEDGSVLTGKYMSVYSEWENPVVFRTIEEVETLTDLYLKKFGDPTAMGANRKPAVKEEKIEVEKQNPLGYVIGGIAAAVLVAAVAVEVVRRRKKNKIESQNS